MKYSAKMGSGAMIYLPGFIKIDSGFRKDRDRISLFSFLLELIINYGHNVMKSKYFMLQLSTRFFSYKNFVNK
jgi:hypothetical protein